MADATFEFDQKYVVLKPAPETVLPIPEPDWRRLVARVSGLSPSTDWFQAVGWLLLGVSATAFFAAIALPSGDVNHTPKLISWASAAVTLISGALSLFYSYCHAKTQTGLKKIIIEDMESLAARFSNRGA